MQTPKTAQKLVCLLCSVARKWQFKMLEATKSWNGWNLPMLKLNASHLFLGQG